MRLNGYFREGPLEAAYITVLLSLPTFKLRRRLDLLIDTGATRTTILDNDAISMGISYDKLTRSKQSLLGLGGLVETYIAKNAKLHFRAQDDSEQIEDLRELLIVRHTHPDANIMRIPSVLGREILNKYRLIYDKAKKEVVITDGEL